jgi:hypothetical protein
MSWGLHTHDRSLPHHTLSLNVCYGLESHCNCVMISMATLRCDLLNASGTTACVGGCTTNACEGLAHMPTMCCTPHSMTFHTVFTNFTVHYLLNFHSRCCHVGPGRLCRACRWCVSGGGRGRDTGCMPRSYVTVCEDTLTMRSVSLTFAFSTLMYAGYPVANAATPPCTSQAVP